MVCHLADPGEILEKSKGNQCDLGRSVCLCEVKLIKHRRTDLGNDINLKDKSTESEESSKNDTRSSRHWNILELRCPGCSSAVIVFIVPPESPCVYLLQRFPCIFIAVVPFTSTFHLVSIVLLFLVCVQLGSWPKNSLQVQDWETWSTACFDMFQHVSDEEICDFREEDWHRYALVRF